MTILTGAGDIKNPITLADQLLQNGYHSGMMTIPYLEGYDFGNNEKTPTLKTIPFYMTNNFNLNLRNNWGEMVSSDLLSSFNNMVQMIGLLRGERVYQGNLQSKTMQTASWTKSDIPQFSINTIFISTSRAINPLKILKAISAGALPSNGNVNVQDAGNWAADSSGVKWIDANINNNEPKLANGIKTIAKNLGLTAPFGYNPNFKLDTESGKMSNSPSTDHLCSLRIGQWFLAKNLIIDSISNIDISKEIIAPPWRGDSRYITENDPFNTYGYPLYVKCTVVFRPYTILTADEFAQCFIDEPNHNNRNNGELISGNGLANLA